MGRDSLTNVSAVLGEYRHDGIRIVIVVSILAMSGRRYCGGSSRNFRRASTSSSVRRAS